MSYTLITADIHLLPDDLHPINQAFYQFLETQAPLADALYLLGDVFESWVGDDAGLEQYATAITKLRTLSEQIPVYLMYGNRDFLLGPAFWKATGIQHLSEPGLVDFYGLPVLLLHGDSLCTEDRSYQRMRRLFRNPLVQWIFLRRSKEKRLAIGKAMREKSQAMGQNKPENIMDVSAEAVETLFRRFPNCRTLVHGHTHRPARHDLILDGHAFTRWVLGDWRPQTQILRIDDQQKISLLSQDKLESR